MKQKLAILAVDGDEEPRPDRIEHLAQLVAVRMPGDVHVPDLGVEDARAMPVQVVDSLVDHPLVARDGPGRDHDPVVFAHVEKRMALRRKSRQC